MSHPTSNQTYFDIENQSTRDITNALNKALFSFNANSNPIYLQLVSEIHEKNSNQVENKKEISF